MQVQNKTFRIVDEDNNVVDNLIGLSEHQADEALTKCMNEGADCFLQDEN